MSERQNEIELSESRGTEVSIARPSSISLVLIYLIFFFYFQTQSEICSGCQDLITDRYLLKVAEGCWHVRCLKCCVCQCDLGLETSCYTKDRKIYCKTDYARWV